MPTRRPERFLSKHRTKRAATADLTGYSPHSHPFRGLGDLVLSAIWLHTRLPSYAAAQFTAGVTIPPTSPGTAGQGNQNPELEIKTMYEPMRCGLIPNPLQHHALGPVWWNWGEKKQKKTKTPHTRSWHVTANLLTNHLHCISYAVMPRGHTTQHACNKQRASSGASQSACCRSHYCQLLKMIRGSWARAFQRL